MWLKIKMGIDCIIGESDSKVLIGMPTKSGYEGYSFWYPKKLIEPYGKSGTLMRLIVHDTFEFHLRKYGSERYNKDKIYDSVSLHACVMQKLQKGRG